jgi:hypothetical protein
MLVAMMAGWLNRQPCCELLVCIVEQPVTATSKIARMHFFSVFQSKNPFSYLWPDQVSNYHTQVERPALMRPTNPKP